MAPRRSKLLIISICLAIIVQIDGRQNEKRRKEKTLIHSPHSHQTNICENGDRTSNIHCYCDQKKPQGASKAECWIFSGSLTSDEHTWLAFSTQTHLKELDFNVRVDGSLHFVPTRALKSLRYLDKFTIKYSSIEEVLPYAFANLTSLKQIVMPKNKIVELKPYAFASLPNLTNIELEENRIVELHRDAFYDLPSLQILLLNRNNISVLHDKAFKHLGQLDELDLDGNSITTLTRETFEGLSKVTKLALRSNRMTMLGDLTFAELWNLERLFLDRNLLQFIAERAFDGLGQLKHLSISENRLSTLTSGLLEDVSGLGFLDLRKNNLETLTFDNIRPIIENMKNASGYIYLDGNNFDCDCRLSWMHMLRNDTKSEKVRSSLEHVTCHLEPDLYGNIPLPEEQMKTTPATVHHHQKHYMSQHNNHLLEKDGNRMSNDDHQYDDGETQEYDEETYEDQQQDSSNPVINNKNQRHLFQIPIDLLPCPEELRDSTDAPLSRLSQGEIKDYRNSCSGCYLESVVVMFACLLMSLRWL